MLHVLDVVPQIILTFMVFLHVLFVVILYCFMAQGLKNCNMKQEKIELLLKDLGARVPYKVKIAAIQNKNYAIILTRELFGSLNFTYWIPYLRSMLNITEEEKKELNTIVEWDGELNGEGGYFVEIPDIPKYIDFLNAHHFDYRGLIEKGLALEAPKEMYKLNN